MGVQVSRDRLKTSIAEFGVISMQISPHSQRVNLRKVGQLEEEPRRCAHGRSSSVRVTLVSSLNAFRRRLTSNLYQRSWFKTNNAETRLSRAELGVNSNVPLPRCCGDLW